MYNESILVSIQMPFNHFFLITKRKVAVFTQDFHNCTVLGLLDWLRLLPFSHWTDGKSLICFVAKFSEIYFHVYFSSTLVYSTWGKTCYYNHEINSMICYSATMKKTKFT